MYKRQAAIIVIPYMDIKQMFNYGLQANDLQRGPQPVSSILNGLVKQIAANIPRTGPGNDSGVKANIGNSVILCE